MYIKKHPLGGNRNPIKSLMRIPGALVWGPKVHDILNKLLDEHPQEEAASLASIGTKDDAVIERLFDFFTVFFYSPFRTVVGKYRFSAFCPVSCHHRRGIPFSLFGTVHASRRLNVSPFGAVFVGSLQHGVAPPHGPLVAQF